MNVFGKKTGRQEILERNVVGIIGVKSAVYLFLREQILDLFFSPSREISR